MPRFENPPYYITAYGLAVKRGFKGTLDEWLASLKGDGVELRYLDDKIQWRRTKPFVVDAETGKDDEAGDCRWHDLINVAEIRGVGRSVPSDADELQKLLDAGAPVLVTKALELTKPIVIDRDNTVLEFTENVVFDMSGKGFPAFQIGSERNPKPTYISLKNIRVQGDKTPGSVGIYLFGAGFAWEIMSPRIFGCEYGIRTRDYDLLNPDGSVNSYHYDCAQQGCLFEPYLGGGRVGLMDAGGGFQNVRVFGGRVEQNGEHGVVSASLNLCFDGTIIQGNGQSEVKLVNSSGYGAARQSGGTFQNCYFERIVRKNANGDSVPEAIFQLGDEAQNNGWFGALNIIGCKLYFYNDNYGFQCLGNAIPGGSESKMIQLMGCTVYGRQLFDMPNVGGGTRIIMFNSSTYGGVELPTWGVNPSANVQYTQNDYAQFGTLRATQILGVGDFEPLNYAYARDFRTYQEKHQVFDDGEFAKDPDGNYVPTYSGVRINRTASDLLPWQDKAAGEHKGSMHFCARYCDDYKTPGWFMREFTAEGADSPDNWVAVLTADAEGVAKRLRMRERLLEAYTYDNAGNETKEYGNWIAETCSDKLPWEDTHAGILKGSMHYCSSVGTWYQRLAGFEETDSAQNWARILFSDAGGVLGNILTRELRVVRADGAHVSVTYSAVRPWLDENAGERIGSLHCADGTWYTRTKPSAGIDTEGNWASLAGGGGLTNAAATLLIAVLKSLALTSQQTSLIDMLALTLGIGGTDTPVIPEGTAGSAVLGEAVLGEMVLGG